MKREKGKNTAASIRARLFSLAQSKGEDYQRVLGNTPLNASCIAWAGHLIVTSLPSREPHSLRCGQATLTGPQRTWIYSGAAHLLPSQKLKQLFERCARFKMKTAFCSAALSKANNQRG